ncbi:ComF family protein [Psychrobacter ciconiae]|uniref:ComF family protein n=1 Tax=Psychrobacter ciconiae TaxID=1553449 RepID=UPI001918D85F|nr:ComF family protein [Psychrobacter ciconiae]
MALTPVAVAPYQLGLWLAEYLNPRCQLCRVGPCAPKQLLCTACHQSIDWQPAPFQIDVMANQALTIQAATYYDYPIRQAIRAFKHSEDLTKLAILVHALRQLPRPHGCHKHNSVIVPMPTTHKRLVNRGFDPVSILVAHLSKHWQIPIWRGVDRVDNTVSQQGLSRSERLTNLTDAFLVSAPPPVKKLILFDDVATTGASLQALAKSLIEFARPNAAFNALNHNVTLTYQITAFAVAHGSASSAIASL